MAGSGSESRQQQAPGSLSRGLIQHRLSWWEWAALAVLLLVGLGLRLNDLTDQPLDFHSTRQLRSAIIARGMYFRDFLIDGRGDIDPAEREQAMTAWNSMERYEPPILESLVAVSYRLAGGEYLWIARVYSSLFWMVGGLALYTLARRFASGSYRPGSDRPGGAALFALGFYLILPWGVVASRSFQPDPFMVMWILLAALAIERWMAAGGHSWGWTLAAGALSGVAVLVKAMAFYPVVGMLAGAYLWLWWSDSRPLAFERLRQGQTWVLPALAGIIPAVYYLGLGAGASEYTSFWIFSFLPLLLDSKFYVRWLGLVRGIVDVMVFFAALAGALLYSGKGRAIAVGLWLGYLLIGLTFPFQIYTHDYYSLTLVPTVALGLAPLIDGALERLNRQPRLWQAAFLIAVLVPTVYYAWIGRSVLLASDYRNEPIPWRKMGDEIPRDENIIALTHDYGNRLKYYSLRSFNRLWPSGGDLELSRAAGSERIDDFESYFAAQTQGMDYFLVTLFADLEAQPLLKTRLYDHYPVAKEGDGYIVFDLRHPH